MKKLLIIFLAIAFLGFTGLGVSLAGEEDNAKETQEQKKQEMKEIKEQKKEVMDEFNKEKEEAKGESVKGSEDGHEGHDHPK